MPVTGGPLGIKGVRPVWSGSSDVAACVFIVATLLAMFSLHSLFAKSALGRVCTACYDVPLFLVNLGLDPSILRIQLLTVAGLLWGACGVFLVSFTSYVEPNMFLIDLAISQLAVAFLAGRNGGVVRLSSVGALFFLGPELLRYFDVDPVKIGVFRDLLLGLIILAWFRYGLGERLDAS